MFIFRNTEAELIDNCIIMSYKGKRVCLSMQEGHTVNELSGLDRKMLREYVGITLELFKNES
jgi:hypothetical protein